MSLVYIILECFIVSSKGPDMHRPKVEIVMFWRATRCGLPKIAQNAKSNKLNSEDLVIFVKSQIWYSNPQS